MGQNIEALYSDAGNDRSPISKLYAQNAQGGALAQQQIKDGFNTGGYDKAEWDGIMNSGLSGIAAQNAYNAYEGNKEFVSDQSSWEQKLALGLSVGALTAGAGSFLAPMASAAVGGGTAGAVAGGAATGAAGGAFTSALAGGKVLKNIGTGALVGGATAGLNTALSSDGLPSPVNSIISKTGTGALRGAISGQGAGAGAQSGAVGGALSAAGGAAGGAIGGSIFNSGNTIPTSGSTDVSASTAGNPSMSVDPSYFSQAGTAFPTYDPTNLGYPSTTNVSTDPGSVGAWGGGINYSDPMAGMGGSNAPTGGYLPTDSSGNVLSSLGSAAGGAAGSSLLGSLAKYLSGQSGGAISPQMLQSLLGFGAQTAGGVLDSNAAKGAASNYANNSAFKPYSVSGPNGTSTFNGTSATSTLSPQQQQMQQMLQHLAGTAGSGLAAGPQGTQTADFNALQSGDLQAQQRLLGNTQDNEFANGVLSSTAGGYQTQGALNAIGNQTNQNQVTAQSMAQNQQQQQLAQLTGSLNGLSGINSQALSQLQTGGSLGSAAAGANSRAYLPSLYANSNSTFGNALTNLGNAASNPGFVNPNGP